MAKAKVQYVCQNCAATSPKWQGRCPNCGEWNTYVEEKVAPTAVNKRHQVAQEVGSSSHRAVPLSQVPAEAEPRFASGDSELDRVLGGGIVPGAVTLLGGEPGIGKSTLMLQVALAVKGRKVLYVSGEESQHQVRMHSQRLGLDNPETYILTTARLREVLSEAKSLQPDLMVVDSIQTLYMEEIESAPGSISQVRECAAALQRLAKERQLPVVLIGHITKEGSLAGPKVLEHMVDTVLQFEGDRHHAYRMLRTLKNRFGSTSELGIYEMSNKGLRAVDNPSELLVSQKAGPTSGTAIACLLEGNRPLLVEVQALVSEPNYGTPQRSATGFDVRRLNMLLAVLDKRSGLQLASQDVFLNIAGGLRVEDPAADLAVCAALVSSLTNRPLSERLCLCGEVGLSGEIRAVSHLARRAQEAQRLGYNELALSQFTNTEGLPDFKTLQLRPYAHLADWVSDAVS